MPSNTVITLQDGIIGIADNAFANYLDLSGMSIPNSVLNIGSGAFIGCSSLATVTLGECIASVGDGAFMNCSNLIDVYCYAREVPLAKSTTFSYSNIIYATLHVPRESINAYRVSTPWKDFKDIVRIIFPTHTLMYVVDGEIYKSLEIEEGETITPEASPTKEGYTFSGWSEIPEMMPAHDVTVNGSFSVNSYTLTYMIDEVVYKQVAYEYGAEITPEAQPEGDYVSFEWVGLPETMPAHDVTVTAVYETGIAEIMMTAQQGQLRIYSPNGKLLNKLQKGLNIVVMQDGTTKKVVVK